MYKNYRSYKPHLQLEFERKCVYCRMPDSFAGSGSFGADHYRPKNQFPELAADYLNLFYCCNECNSYKGDAWVDPPAPFVPNPVDHIMFDHLRFKGGEVEHRSKAGEFAVELLNLNDPEAIEYRESVIHTLSVLEERLSELFALEKALKKSQKTAGGSVPDVVAALSTIAKEKDKTVKSLRRFSGML